MGHEQGLARLAEGTALQRPLGMQARWRLRVDMTRAHDVGTVSFEPNSHVSGFGQLGRTRHA
jgi:hypothetical protein